jgi:molecular chaperone GrpE
MNKDKTPTEPVDESRARSTGGDDESDGVSHESIAESLAGANPLADELADANDRALRLQAEMQNLRARTSREIADERRYAAMPILRDLLPVLDNIDRAIEAAQKAGDAGNLLEGFRLVRQQLATVIEQHHCEPIPADSQPFDPNYHAAILQQPSADVPAGTVTMVTQIGYKLHDRVVRPAQVIVSSGPPQ